MTGDELTATLLRHGVEVVEASGQSDMRGRHQWRITARDVAGVGDLEALLPHNVEMTLQRRELTMHFIGSNPYGPMGRSQGEIREVRVRGRNSDVLTSPPLTARQLGAAMVDARPVPASQRPPTLVPRAPRQQHEQISAQPLDFRADLFQRLVAVVGNTVHDRWRNTTRTLSTLSDFTRVDNTGIGATGWQWGWGTVESTAEQQRQLLRRWSVYQALKPLYDVVDGVEGATSAAMPRDVEVEWNRRAGIRLDNIDGDHSLERLGNRLVSRQASGSVVGTRAGAIGDALQHMPSILDAVAVARVAICNPDHAEWRGAMLRPILRDGTVVAWETLQSAPLTPPTLCSFNAADLRRAISSDYDIVAVTPLRQPSEPNRGQYLVEVQLLEERGYRCSTTNLPRGVTVRYDVSDGGARDVEVRGVRGDLVADLDDSPVLRWPTASMIRGQRADLLIVDDAIEPSLTLTLDALTTSLPCLFPGGEPRVTGVKRASGRDGVFTMSVQLEKVAGSTVSASAVASSLPSNVVLAVTTQTGAQREFRGTGSARLEVPPQKKRIKETTTRPPPVTAQMVRNLRRGRSLGADDAALDFSRALGNDLVGPAVETIKTIVQLACYGLDDKAAAERASCYHILIGEAKTLGVSTAEHVATWCKQFQTRFNLLDLDEDAHTTTVATSTLKRGTKPPTAAQVRKFRDAFEGRSAVSATECAKVANFGDDEVSQHLLVSHCGGLSDDEAATLLAKAHQELFVVTLPSVDAWARHHRQQRAATLEPDPSADPSATVAVWRGEQQRRRARAAELRSKTVRRVVEAAAPRTRWDLLELDGAVLPPAEELRVKSALRHVQRPAAAPPWQPTAPKHIDVALPEPTVDYVDVSMLPQELHGVAVTSCLLDEASRQVGAVKAN